MANRNNNRQRAERKKGLHPGMVRVRSCLWQLQGASQDKIWRSARGVPIAMRYYLRFYGSFRHGPAGRLSGNFNVGGLFVGKMEARCTVGIRPRVKGHMGPRWPGTGGTGRRFYSTFIPLLFHEYGTMSTSVVELQNDLACNGTNGANNRRYNKLCYDHRNEELRKI